MSERDESINKLSNRLISLDVFRGMTIMGMILVNNPGSWSYVYKPLDHAPWHGWTPTDLIFPFFLFIVGVAMSLSFKNRLERGDSQKQLFLKIIVRTIILFTLGLFLNMFPYFKFSEMRIPGVLQRIALCYFFASLIILKCSKKFIYQNWFVPWAGNMNGSLFFAIAYILFWLGIMVILYRKKIFIKI